MNQQDEQVDKAPWWRDGIIIFAKVSGYIAFPIIFASVLGKYLDKKYNTGSLIFLISVSVAFISTIYLIWNEMRVYKKKLEKEEKK